MAWSASSLYLSAGDCGVDEGDVYLASFIADFNSSWSIFDTGFLSSLVSALFSLFGLVLFSMASTFVVASLAFLRASSASFLASFSLDYEVSCALILASAATFSVVLDLSTIVFSKGGNAYPTIGAAGAYPTNGGAGAYPIKGAVGAIGARGATGAAGSISLTLGITLLYSGFTG